MTFNEEVQAMLDGKKVTRANPTGHGYIMLNGDGDVVGNKGTLYKLGKNDFIGDWKIVGTPSAGKLLTRYGKSYRLIKETGDTYAILDEETYVEHTKGIAERDLMQTLMCYDFDID